MQKKIISLICALSLTGSASALNVTAEENTGTSHAGEVLQALGLMTGEKKVTYDSFVSSLSRFLYENPEALGTPEDIAMQTGMTDGTEEYNGGSPITFNTAIKYAVTTLGYKTKAMELGGDINSYLTVASQLGLLSGVEAFGDSVILINDAETILYNMLDAEPMVSYYESEYNKGYKIASGETLLSLNRDIFEVTGMLTANEDTSLYGETGAAEGCVQIDDNEYYVSENCNTDLLGHNIVSYIKEDSYGEQTVIHMYSKASKNKVLTMDAESIDNVASDISEIEYSDANGKLRSAKLDVLPKVIFNGVFHDGYTAEDLAPDTGSITLTDNNKDGKYDIVSITSYQTMVVEGINSSEYTIYNKYDFEGCLDRLKLDENETDYVIYNPEGKEITFADITPGDVLSVAKSKNNANAEVYVSGNGRTSGTVNNIRTEDGKITVTEKEYTLTDEFSEFLNSTDKSISVGNRYTFYIDYFGNIVYMESEASDDYCVFYKVYEEDEQYIMMYMDSTNVWHSNVLSDNIKFNGEKKDPSFVFGTLKNAEPQVMKIQTNIKNMVSSVEVATISSVYAEDIFTRTNEATYVYRQNPNCFAMQLYLESDSVLFVFPSDKSDRDEYYARNANGFFSADRSYTIVSYDQDEYSFCPAFSITDTENTQQQRANKGLFIVTKVFDKMVDGDVVSVIQGNYGEYKNLTLVGNSYDTYNDIEVGDVVNVGLNTYGRANYVKKIMSLDNFSLSDPVNYYQSSAVLSGIVEKIDLDKKRIRINCGNSVPFRITADTSVQIYNQTTKKCEMKTASELTVNDKIVCRLSSGTISEIACVRER